MRKLPSPFNLLLLFLGIWVLLAGIFTIYTCSLQYGSGGLPRLENSDFESGDSSSPPAPLSWKYDSFKIRQAGFAWGKGAGYQETAAVGIYHDDSANDSRWYQELFFPEDGVYELSGKVKTEKVEPGPDNPGSQNGAALGVQARNAYPNLSRAVTGTSDWQDVSLTFQASRGDTLTIQLRLGMFGNTVKGRAWFDDLIIKKTY